MSAKPTHRADADMLAVIVELAMRASLFEPGRRALLLEGLPVQLVGDLRSLDRPAEQLRSDVHSLSGFPMLAGAMSPLLVWLDNAVALLGERPEAEALRSEAARLRGSPVPAGLLLQWRFHEGAPPLGEAIVRPDGMRRVLGRRHGGAAVQPATPTGFIALTSATHRVSAQHVWVEARADEARVGRPPGAGLVAVDGVALRTGEERVLEAWAEIDLAGALSVTVERLI